MKPQGGGLRMTDSRAAGDRHWPSQTDRGASCRPADLVENFKTPTPTQGAFLFPVCLRASRRLADVVKNPTAPGRPHRVLLYSLLAPGHYGGFHLSRAKARVSARLYTKESF
ncbi:hypothetical protein RRG08_056638 [Elysia crispata]|uniref:Uncharacterized protein n=1 Tax=Elysia crispata TaxID=231223 RepID=A0AAE0Y0C9_9GAST|nr:hypothetical protein RRG08_056638 [Elysia crispata]